MALCKVQPCCNGNTADETDAAPRSELVFREMSSVTQCSGGGGGGGGPAMLGISDER